MAAVKKLSGENIYLGPVSKESIPRLVKWMNDLEVVKYTCQASANHTEETAREYLEKVLIDHSKAYFGIYTKEGELIGSTDLTNIDGVNRKATLGIIIGEKDYWNKGYGTEAVRLLIDYGFNILNLNNIMLIVFGYNPRGIKCYEKAGFKAIGRRRKSRFFAGQYYDEVYMDILAEEHRDSKIKGMAK